VRFPESVLATPAALRPFAPRDAPLVRRLADDWDVAKTTAALPHPYLDGMAEAWIAGHAQARQSNAEHSYAITRASDGVLVGALGLRPRANQHGHFGFWVGKSHWGNGYATAAAGAAIALLFAGTELDAVWAVHLADNLGSARVMDRCGMRVLRDEQRIHRGDVRAFLVREITREEWEALRG
jgi:ribosomal-protein-alanine N-acetyltransferase